MTFKELLEQHEITPYRLYKLTGIAQTSLSKYINNITSPLRMPFEHAYKIAKVLNMTMEELYIKLTEE